MTTLQNWIDTVEDHVYSTDRPRRNRLTNQITGSATSLVLDYDVLPSVGDTISIGTQDAYVWAVDTSTRTVTIEMTGGNAETHAAGSHVLISPRVSRAAIYRALNEEMRSLSAVGLFRVRNLSLTYNASASGYDFAATDLLSDELIIDYDQPGPSMYWPTITNYRVSRDLPTTDFASGTAIMLFEGAYPGQAIRVRYKAKFGALGTTLASDVGTDTGLHTEAHDIPPIGAAARLIAPQEIKRTNPRVQGDTRRPEEVPPGSTFASARNLLQLRAQRINEETTRLQLIYPSRIR